MCLSLLLSVFVNFGVMKAILFEWNCRLCLCRYTGHSKPVGHYFLAFDLMINWIKLVFVCNMMCSFHNSVCVIFEEIYGQFWFYWLCVVVDGTSGILVVETYISCIFFLFFFYKSRAWSESCPYVFSRIIHWQGQAQCENEHPYFSFIRIINLPSVL